MGVIRKIKKNILRSVSEGLAFGSDNYTSMLSFTIRIITLALPGIVLGHYLDQGIYWTKKQKWLGLSAIPYVFAQIVAWILIFYSIFFFASSYAMEFQGTVAGIFFVTLFFVVQTNFVTNLQTMLGTIDTNSRT
jgi:hypothetical protein